MGHTTDFVGHIDISPALNAPEIEYLSAFSLSRRFDRPEGPYAVPGNPYAESAQSYDRERYNRPAPGQPQLYCQWSVCWDGCCLAFDGNEKFYAPVPWMRYLVDHFLRPSAAASRSGDPQFEQFTFDHRLDGMVVGCRRDTKELFSITVVDNDVVEQVLRRGDPVYDGYPPLPYEAVIDRDKRERPRSRRSALSPVPSPRG